MIKINLEELKRIKGEITEINEQILTILKIIENEIYKLSSLINTNEINVKINEIKDQIKEISSNSKMNLVLLDDFLGKQINSYLKANEEAEKSLNALLTTLNDNFYENNDIDKKTTIKTTNVITETQFLDAVEKNFEYNKKITNSFERKLNEEVEKALLNMGNFNGGNL